MSDPIKTIYAPEHARMLKALTDDKAIVVYHRSGPTWNDGGAWHRIVARLTDGTHVSVKMESDYAPGVLLVEPLKQWPPRDDKDARIVELTRQLDATLMELAETQALELQHGAVIERLMGQLAKARAKALDEAAQVSDAMMDSWAAATYRNPDARVQNAARAYAAGEIAATIRNLKGPTP